jgi:cupin superfamily acireductone dioxygenase involved in methionine salvage
MNFFVHLTIYFHQWRPTPKNYRTETLHLAQKYKSNEKSFSKIKNKSTYIVNDLISLNNVFILDSSYEQNVFEIVSM